MPQEPFLFILLLLTLFSLLAAAAAAILAAKAAGNGRTDMDGLYNALDRQRTALSEEAPELSEEPEVKESIFSATALLLSIWQRG